MIRHHQLRTFQLYHQKWLEHNFPNQSPHQALLGLAEEVGELAHAHLKYEQAIRGLTKGEYERQAEDAIGDIIIYLASYCNTNGFDMAKCLEKAWEEVSARDWRANPESGVATELSSTEVRGESDERVPSQQTDSASPQHRQDGIRIVEDISNSPPPSEGQKDRLMQWFLDQRK